MHHNALAISSLQRLRIEHRIIGYRRLENGTPFFSKDLFWWDGTRLPYTLLDDATIYRTKSNRILFENDIIEVTEKSWFGMNHSKRQFRVAKENNTFVLIDLNKDSIEPLNYLESVLHYDFLSYVFINKKALSIKEKH